MDGVRCLATLNSVVKIGVYIMIQRRPGKKRGLDELTGLQRRAWSWSPLVPGGGGLNNHTIYSTLARVD